MAILYTFGGTQGILGLLASRAEFSFRRIDGLMSPLQALISQVSMRNCVMRN